LSQCGEKTNGVFVESTI